MLHHWFWVIFTVLFQKKVRPEAHHALRTRYVLIACPEVSRQTLYLQQRGWVFSVIVCWQATQKASYRHSSRHEGWEQMFAFWEESSGNGNADSSGTGSCSRCMLSRSNDLYVEYEFNLWTEGTPEEMSECPVCSLPTLLNPPIKYNFSAVNQNKAQPLTLLHTDHPLN